MRPLTSLTETSANAFCNIVATHCFKIKSGNIADVYTSNSILNVYSKRGEITLARNVFDEMSHRDSVSWNTMIAGYVNSGSFETAFKLLKCMKELKFDFDGYTFGSILKGVAFGGRLETGQQIHSLIVKSSFDRNVYAGSALLDMYAKCEKIDDAYLVFQELPEPNSVSWNALISGFAKVGDRDAVFRLLKSMELEDVDLDDATFAPIISLLDGSEFMALTMQVHGKVLKRGLNFDNTVCNAMISSYAESGSLEDAKKVFDFSSVARDLVSWNSMLAAYLIHEEEESAFKLFLAMQEIGIQPDIYTYTSIISSCFEEKNINHGKFLHGLAIKRGLEQSSPVANALIAMYLKSNYKSVEDAVSVFKFLDWKDRVSWNSILTGFSQNGLSEDCIKFYGIMRSLVVEIDHYTFSAVLRSCSDLATLQLGQSVHAQTMKSGFESNDSVASSLIFMYSKCGIIEDARKSFDETSKDSTIAWNSIIFGYAQHGLGDLAIDLFHQMKSQKVKLDHITFVGVLTACSHIGLVQKGHEFLNSMEAEYNISPRNEHYACVVDLLGRAGKLEEAKDLIESMPIEPDSMVLKTFLGACRSCGNIEMATEVAKWLLELEPEEHCTYVLLCNMYSDSKRWSEKASVTKLMRERGVKKVPGWSWIEVKNQVHSFNAHDRSHSHCEEIYIRLQELTEEIRWFDCDTTSTTFVAC